MAEQVPDESKASSEVSEDAKVKKALAEAAKSLTVKKTRGKAEPSERAVGLHR